MQSRQQFLRSLVAWTAAFWVTVYVLLTLRSLLIRPDLSFLDLAGTRALMIPVGIAFCGVLFVTVERMAALRRGWKAAALAALVAAVMTFYFTINYYLFHNHAVQLGDPHLLIKVASYLVEFFWLFPAWMLLYAYLRHRAAAPEPASRDSDGIWIRDRGRHVWIPADALHSLEAERDYVRVRTKDHAYLVRSTMAAMERQLRQLGFIRIHRGVIVSAKLIETIERQPDGRALVTLSTGASLPVGRAYLPQLKQLTGAEGKPAH